MRVLTEVNFKTLKSISKKAKIVVLDKGEEVLTKDNIVKISSSLTTLHTSFNSILAFNKNLVKIEQAKADRVREGSRENALESRADNNKTANTLASREVKEIAKKVDKVTKNIDEAAKILDRLNLTGGRSRGLLDDIDDFGGGDERRRRRGRRGSGRGARSAAEGAATGISEGAAEGASRSVRRSALKSLARGNVVMDALLVGVDYSDRKSEGQSTAQAAIGAGAGLGGAIAGAELGATIGAVGGPVGALIGGLIGGALGYMTASSAADAITGADSIQARRASGGRVQKGKAYIVGEKGPEIFIPGESGSITPHNIAGVRAVRRMATQAEKVLKVNTQNNVMNRRSLASSDVDVSKTTQKTTNTFTDFLKSIFNKVKGFLGGIFGGDDGGDGDSAYNIDGASGPPAGSSAHAKQAYDYFVSKGWTSIQAAAIVGSLQNESGANLDPHITNSIGATGIAQWYPKGNPRAFTDFQKLYGKPLKGSSFEEQLEFLQWELTKGPESSGAGQRIRNATNIQDAVMGMSAFERWGNGYRDPRAGENRERYRDAQAILDAYGNALNTSPMRGSPPGKLIPTRASEETAASLRASNNGTIWSGKTGKMTTFIRKIGKDSYEIWTSDDSTRYTIDNAGALATIQSRNMTVSTKQGGRTYNTQWAYEQGFTDQNGRVFQDAQPAQAAPVSNGNVTHGIDMPQVMVWDARTKKNVIQSWSNNREPVVAEWKQKNGTNGGSYCAVGDSIAVGLTIAAPEFTRAALGGEASGRIYNFFHGISGTQLTVVSMGSNDSGRQNVSGINYTYYWAKKLRQELKGKIVWLLPYARQFAQQIQKIASEYGDSTVDLTMFKTNDGIHPDSWKLAAHIRKNFMGQRQVAQLIPDRQRQAVTPGVNPGVRQASFENTADNSAVTMLAQANEIDAQIQNATPAVIMVPVAGPGSTMQLTGNMGGMPGSAASSTGAASGRDLFYQISGYRTMV